MRKGGDYLETDQKIPEEGPPGRRGKHPGTQLGGLREDLQSRNL